MVAVLRTAGISASMARKADGHDWFLTACAARVNPPSDKTIALVIEILESGAELAEPECACHQVDVDLFDAEGCPLHDPNSAFRRSLQAQEQEPATAVITTSEECPF